MSIQVVDGSNTSTLLTENMDNFRSLDYHFVSPPVLTATVAGASYQASGWFRSDTPGRQLCLRVRERLADGTYLYGSSCIMTTSAWQAFPLVAYTTAAAGDRLDVYVAEYGAKNGDSFEVDGLSLGTDSVQPWDIDPLNAAVERAWAAGIVVVVSASNLGPAPGSISKPGDDPWVITVGAADDHGTAPPDDDRIAAFSAHGPTHDGLTKPDVVAPGAGRR